MTSGVTHRCRKSEKRFTKKGVVMAPTSGELAKNEAACRLAGGFTARPLSRKRLNRTFLSSIVGSGHYTGITPPSALEDSPVAALCSILRHVRRLAAEPDCARSDSISA